jgi:catechol 2,3-dioxygenase-like lactoylglutathione lyase family enzyme
MGNQVSVRGLNHITLAVSDVERSIRFYTGGLGLHLRKQSRTATHLEAGSFWICLSPDPETRKEPHPDYTHIAFDVPQEDFAAMVAQLERAGARQWKDNRSEGDSYYFLDPDGHKLEIHVGTLESRLAAMKD